MYREFWKNKSKDHYTEDTSGPLHNFCFSFPLNLGIRFLRAPLGFLGNMKGKIKIRIFSQNHFFPHNIPMVENL